MVIDTPALLAILLGEAEADQMVDAIERDQRRLLSAVQLLDAAVVIEARKGASGGRELDLLLHRAQVQIVNFTAELAESAREAWRRWGKGRHPPASDSRTTHSLCAPGLNFCDCCAYALAQQLGEPLLYKGDDFRRTDVRVAA
jgi:ribonuclease VapC